MTDTADTPATIPAEDGKTETVNFEHGVKRGDTRIMKVLVRKPMGGDLRGTQMPDLLNSDYDTMLKVVPRISTPPIMAHEIDKMEGDDLVELFGTVVNFFVGKARRASLGL